MGVARQRSEHRRRSGEGALSLDHPFTLAQRREPWREGLRVGKRRLVAEELPPAGAMRGGEFFEEAAAEEPREHACQEEEPGSATPSTARPPPGTMPCTCG
jgi:hypothetical protein